MCAWCPTCTLPSAPGISSFVQHSGVKIENSPKVAGATVGEFRFYKKSSLFHLSYVGLNDIDCIVAQAFILIDDIKVVY